MTKRQLLSFLNKSSRSDYSSGDPKDWKKEKDGSTTISYRSGDWESQDNFFGGEPYGGRQVVFYKKQPVWIFIYYGWVEPVVNTYDEVYEFLKISLKAGKGIFRGPVKFKKGRFVYTNSHIGSIEKFKGEEKIYKNSKQVYKAMYMGGWVDQRR